MQTNIDIIQNLAFYNLLTYRKLLIVPGFARLTKRGKIRPKINKKLAQTNFLVLLFKVITPFNLYII